MGILNTVVRLERLDSAILLVEINRPDARNAVNGDVAAGIDMAVRESEDDPEIRVVVLTGAGDRAFCAGADLKALAAGEQQRLRTPLGGFAGFVNYPRSKPWIAAVNGAALAGGCELALACDLIVACDTATFGLPEVRRGLIAAGGGVYRLVRALPRAIAMEAILTGAPISAATAHAAGLISQVVPSSKLKDEAVRIAHQIANNAPLAVKESLGIARQAFDRSDAELAAISQAASSRVIHSEDFDEGARAFIEKRTPNWKGR